MSETHSNIAEPLPVTERTEIHKLTATTAMSIAGCALATFVVGAALGAAWAAAFASFGISLMGVGVAWVMLQSR
jgi:hypothetical protein